MEKTHGNGHVPFQRFFFPSQRCQVLPCHILCISSSASPIGTTNAAHLALADIWKTNASGHAKRTQTAGGLCLKGYEDEFVTTVPFDHA